MDSFTMKAKCWTPEDRNILNDLTVFCAFSQVGMSIIRTQTHATITFNGFGEAYNKLKDFIKGKYDEQSKI